MTMTDYIATRRSIQAKLLMLDNLVDDSHYNPELELGGLLRGVEDILGSCVDLQDGSEYISDLSPTYLRTKL